ADVGDEVAADGDVAEASADAGADEARAAPVPVPDPLDSCSLIISCRFLVNTASIWSVTLPITLLPMAAALPDKVRSALTLPSVAAPDSDSCMVTVASAAPWR